MPELPEVETIARGLAKRVTGEVIESVWLGQKKEPLKSSAAEIASALEQSRIAAVRRVGKHIVFDLNRGEPASPRRKKRKKEVSRSSTGAHSHFSGAGRAASAELRSQWIVHLGMTGSLRVCAPQSDLAKHTHAILKLASGQELRFVDPRRFGRLSVGTVFEATGLEPLEIDIEHFTHLFRGRKTPIKSALLNQKLLRGVGNIYADESLF